jgi:hypothetical protein
MRNAWLQCESLNVRSVPLRRGKWWFYKINRLDAEQMVGREIIYLFRGHLASVSKRQIDQDRMMLPHRSLMRAEAYAFDSLQFQLNPGKMGTTKPIPINVR